jgi:uncharacterized protein (DUF2062 family)
MPAVKKTIKQVETFIVRRILHIDDTPHRLALGIALGIFVAWTPTIGVQMVLVVLLATMCRANKLVGIPMVWISNPFTLPLVYYPNYLIGRYLLGLFNAQTTTNYSFRQLENLLAKFHDMSFYEMAFWDELGRLLLDIGKDLWLGSIIIGLFSGIIVYIFSYRFIIWYRTHTPRGRLHVLRMLRKKRMTSASADEDKYKNA